jgi:hypothetical protein
LTYDDIINRLLPDSDDWKKDVLYEDFKVLEEDFPDKQNILEHMRIILLHSLSLPHDVAEQYDAEVEQRLNDLLHFRRDVEACKEANSVTEDPPRDPEVGVHTCTVDARYER